jgi:KDO2-lipid IV(A) lauroyltransferase
MSDNRKPLHYFRSPRYWPTWIGMAVLRMLCLLPHRVALAIGRGLGRIAERLAGNRRAVVRRNIELCFPELTTPERNALATRHFEALGMSLVEMGLGRWAGDRFHRKVARLDGIEHLRQALDSGKGVILLSAHFTTLEISGRLLAMNCPPFDAVFRKNRSEFITELQRTGRERSADETIEKRDIKKMVRSLRAGRPVWYAPDQSYDRKGAAVIPFFGVPSMHTTATSTLARLGDAVTLPYFPRRLDDGSYVHTILPPIEDFPGDDPAEDAKKYVHLLEEHIRRCPEQYFWIHRKFKNLPDGYDDYYAALDALK